MKDLISKAVTYVGSLLQTLQVKSFLAVALVGFLLLTTNPNLESGSKAATKEIDKIAHQNNSDRPKTTGEWNKEARETKGESGDRLGRIGKESVEAVKDFGQMYSDTAERSVDALKDNAARSN
ncbi:MAG: hypothetical protein KME43_03380 [Myxacorys chilensis ATA2-1-KO14]|jgi:hypothetical protein|nr:hypothetical protein [Myxacorys chilensis ATA2-1-KO14]